MSDGAPFRVVPLAEPAACLRRWGEWASQQGGQVYADFLQTLRTINFRLTREPLEWGESRQRYEALDLQMRFGSFLMLSVWYGVSEERRVVFVTRVIFVASYPHGQPPPG